MSHCNRAIHPSGHRSAGEHLRVSRSKRPVPRPARRDLDPRHVSTTTSHLLLVRFFFFPGKIPRVGNLQEKTPAMAHARAGLSSARWRTPAHGPRSLGERRTRTGAVGASRRSAHHVVTSPRAARAPSPARAPRCPRMRHYSAERVGRTGHRGGKGRRRRRGEATTRRRRRRRVEVRRKVVKVTVALTARARNNIGV